jgi:protein O-mannosyl-transferase
MAGMASSKSARGRPWIPHVLSCVVLLALVAVAYSNSLHGAFIFDDSILIQQYSNLAKVKSVGDALSLLRAEGLPAGREFLHLTYAFNYYFGGLNTFGYHLVNVLLHAVNVLLVYAIILSALRDKEHRTWAALAGAAVFAVHTLLSSAVSYIAGRSSVMCATFYFGAVWLFFQGLNSDRRKVKWMFFAFATVAGVLALGTKQEGITLPVFLAAVVFLRTETPNWRWIGALSAIPLVLMALLWNQIKTLYALTSVNKELLSAGFGAVLPPATYFRTYIASVANYFLPRFLVPVRLSIDPQFAAVDHWYSPQFLFAVLVLGGLASLAVLFYRRAPLLSLAVTALLVSPLIAYAAIPLADVVLEHRAYIPGLGIAFLYAWLFDWIRRHYFSARWPAVAIVVATLVYMTISRNQVLATSVSVWEDAVAKGPEKARSHFNLAQAYQFSGRLPDAAREYERTLALNPDIHTAYSNLAAIYLDLKQLDKSEEMLLKMTSRSPGFTEGFLNLGTLYIRKQKPDKALIALDHALEIAPDSFTAHYNKGEALTQKGDYKAALESYKAAVRIRPDLDALRLTLGAAYLRAGDPNSAEKLFNDLTGTTVAPEAYRNLGLLYDNAGQLDQALLYFKRAADLKPVFPDLHHDMGVVYLRKRMPDEAIAQFRTTLQQQPDHGPAAINLATAYQVKGDIPAARQVLQSFIQQYGNLNAPYVAQARQRLLALQ